MESLFDFGLYTRWSGYTTLFFAVFAILAFILGWGFRFRLVGITGFMAVLTGGLFGLSLGLFSHVEIPGATRYSLVYDNGLNQTVIAVAPEISETEVEATLRQAAEDLFSYGRIGKGGDRFVVRMRTVIHPEPGVSEPLYLGFVERSLENRTDAQVDVTIFKNNLAKLSTATGMKS